MRELGPEEIASLVGLLLVLVIWIGALRNQNGWNREMKRRRDAREAQERGETPPPPPHPGERRGPWD